MRTVAILIFSLFITLNANSALALTCKSGTADCTQSNNNASDCTALGYTNANAANCTHYLYCPFNTAYKSCVAFDDSNTGCESKGYSTNKPTATGYLCKDVTVSLNGVNSTCYDCVTCKDEDLITSNTCQQICQNYGIDAQSRSYYKINTITSLNNRTGGPCYNGTYSIHKSDCCCEGTSSVALANCEEPVEPADCSDYPLTNCPEHGICDKCPDDETYKKLTGCESGYTLNASGTGCILSTCPTGYAKTADDCYNKGSAGWSLDLTDKYDSTDCYKCTAKSCEVGYSTETTTCEAGYELVTKDYSGDDACGKCVEKDCSTGYSKSITSETDCSAGYEFEQDPDNPLCGKCNVNCANQYKELKILAAVAEKSYFNCCKANAIYETNLCRTSANNSVYGCLSKRNGAWDDGCFSRFEKIIDNDSDLELGADYTSITEAIAACKAKLQNIKETIRFYNSECPNNKITDNINISNCEHVMFHGDTLGDIDQNLSFDYRGCPDGYSGTGGH